MATAALAPTTLASTNCEFLRRPGMAVSLPASALRVAIEELRKGTPGCLGSTLKFVKGKKDFIKYLKVLDMGKTKQPDKKNIEHAMNVFVDTLQNLDAGARKGVSDLAVSSVRLYLFAMNALEAAGLLGNPKLYARKPEKTADGRKYFSDFIKKPGDPNRLKAMLVCSLQQKIKQTKEAKRGMAAKDASDPDTATTEDSTNAATMRTLYTAPKPPNH